MQQQRCELRANCKIYANVYNGLFTTALCIHRSSFIFLYASIKAGIDGWLAGWLISYTELVNHAPFFLYG
jgi:hypothetical protein